MSEPSILAHYVNGNANITLLDDGTRIITNHGKLQLTYPLNLDIKVSSYCPLGYNKETKEAKCKFCHESATTSGKECDYTALKSKLEGLPQGIELAIGCNHLTTELEDFLTWCTSKGYVVNLTVNSITLPSISTKLRALMETNTIKGLGISYRQGMTLPDSYFLKHENVILHVIAGVDNVGDIVKLPFNKILVLGYKQFGFGKAYYSQAVEDSLKAWREGISQLFTKPICSFDNLALEQLDIKRYLSLEMWTTFYQGEHSFYIDAVTQQFSPSSRDPKRDSWDKYNVTDYYKQKISTQH